MTNGQQLLAQYVETGSETAFRELVGRYVDLVYSAAVRLVNGDTHRAEDVTQTVFADLARQARTLSREVMLGGWLHRHTCFVASNTMRGERRREARERQAVEMNDRADHSAENLALIAPMLDEAVNQLGAEDRRAILLRYFEQHDFRSVGEALGSNEEAARKRVDRALDKLQSFLKARGVVLSATALATTLATQTVTAAPVGFAMTISTVALAGVATGATTTTLTVLKIMSMTKLKVGIVTAMVAAGVAVPWVMHHQEQLKLTAANAALQQQTERNRELVTENDRLNQLALHTKSAPAAAANPSLELLRLRGEVARLRHDVASEQARTNGPSVLSGIKADPGMWKVIRDQQKVGMSAIYKDFAKKLNLPPEQAEKLKDLLADNVMENIDHITAVLRDGISPAEMEPIFAGQEAALLEKIQTLLGSEGVAQYEEYTQRLASNITAEQFKGMLSGDKAEQEVKARQLYDVMLAETKQFLATAGLPADFQMVPTLNFRNIASEAEAEKNLKFLDAVYEGVIARSGSFLSPEELVKLGEFRSTVINGNRMSLTMNRKMMAPGAK